jgi:hypothetical protein
MAQVSYRANLSARNFPFLAQNWGRSIIVPQYDNTFSRQLTSQEDVDKDVGIPQIFYCHNVMPHQQGFQSVGYTQVQDGYSSNTSADLIFLVRDGTGNSIYLVVDITGKIYRQTGGVWIYITTLANTSITYAYISGVTYIYVANVGCYKYDFSSNTLVPVTLTGTDPTKILGITYSAGYMIAWTSSTVAWSSTIDPTDFVPSLTTGAGGGSPEGARGAINLCFTHTLGFIVYTSNNAVSALFSGNTRYPFNFREIVASGGLNSGSQIAYDANSGNHYAYTTSGMQLISTTQTQTILPELTDFVAGKLFEDYDEITDTFTSQTLTSTMVKQVQMIADRYLIISYGISSLTHAVVYDLTDKRWGKLKIPHVQCFEYQIPVSGVTEIPRQSIAFLQADGSIQIVDFSVTSSTSSGVIALGKYQFVRQRVLQLDEINLENVQAGATFDCYDMVALDGKNTSKVVPTLLESSGLFRKYGLRATGINHSIILKGSFSLVSLVLSFNIHGKR